MGIRKRLSMVFTQPKDEKDQDVCESPAARVFDVKTDQEYSVGEKMHNFKSIGTEGLGYTALEVRRLSGISSIGKSSEGDSNQLHDIKFDVNEFNLEPNLSEHSRARPKSCFVPSMESNIDGRGSPSASSDIKRRSLGMSDNNHMRLALSQDAI